MARRPTVADAAETETATPALMPDLPVRILATRWLCPFCHRGRSSKAATTDHIERCWKNPENRTCKSCANYAYYPGGETCFPGRPCNCNDAERSCRADVDLPPVGQAVGFPVVDCPLWEPRGADYNEEG